MTEPADPHRRQADGRPQRPALIAPTPGLDAAVPAEVRRSIDVALERARAGRRHVTLVAAALPADVDGGVYDHLAAALRRAIRSGDGLWSDGPRSMVALLADLSGPGAQPVLERLERVVQAFAGDGVELGRASAPPGIGALDLLDLARADRRPVAGG